MNLSNADRSPYQPLSKVRRKLITALARKKMRSEKRRFLAEGRRLVSELGAIPDRVEFLYGTADALSTLQGALRQCEAFLIEGVDSDLFSTEHPQGIGAVVAMAEEPSWQELATTERPILFLDGIADPGNAGTILRMADWFGIGAVLFGGGSVDPYNPKTVRASMGAAFRITIRENVHPGDLLSLERPVFALDKGGEKVLGSALLPQQGIYVVGNEAHGLSGFWQGKAERIAIPGAGTGESLNAAMAASILCWELSRFNK